MKIKASWPLGKMCNSKRHHQNILKEDIFSPDSSRVLIHSYRASTDLGEMLSLPPISSAKKNETTNKKTPLPQPCKFAWRATRRGLAPRRHAPGLLPPHCGQEGITAILSPAQTWAYYFSGIRTPAAAEFCSPQRVQALVGWESRKHLYLHPASRTWESHSTACSYRNTGEGSGFGRYEH